MLHVLFNNLEWHINFVLIFALIFVLIYEAINGFHDTANSVAIIIYTRALHSRLAVCMSGIFNFLGVFIGGVSVAYSIVHLLPIDLLFYISSAQGLTMIISILLTAIFWNLGTWYLALPTSSSHTLFGSIIGISLTNALVNNTSIKQALNIPKFIEIILSLILSPIIGLILAGLMLLMMRCFYSSNKNNYNLHMTPKEREKKYGKHKPPFYIRVALIFSAAGVSFSHGANDGQKGIGLIMLLLIAVAPTNFAVNMHSNSYDIKRTYDAVSHIHNYFLKNRNLINKCTNYDINSFFLQKKMHSKLNKEFSNIDFFEKKAISNHEILENIKSTKHILILLKNLNNYNQLNSNERFYIRRMLMCIADSIDKIIKLSVISRTDKSLLIELKKDLLKTLEYAPLWIITSVAVSLSLGTMIGWRRVTVTIGEKIGKRNMTYAQGLSAQTTTAISIGIASYTGIPVSTTHVLSSAIAGTMIVDRCGIQHETIKNIFTAWILTIPITMFMAGIIYWIMIKILLM